MIGEQRRQSLAVIAMACLLVVSWLWFGGSAGATDGSLPPGGTFIDDDDLMQEGFIEAIAAAGVTKGCNPPANDMYCPGDTVTRAQVASFLVRALDLPAADTPDQFTDDDDSPHEADIDALVSAGITHGCNPPDNDEFCPDRPVTRGEMAAFLVRAFGYQDRGDIDRFVDDDNSVFEADIERLAAAGITSGCGPDTYCPWRPIKRSNLAVFLARALRLEPIIPPMRPKVIGEFTTYHACCQSRVTNIHLIADAVDGAVVPAGETWSLNDYVGKRTVDKGYVAAGAIIGGELVCCDRPENIGGGTSQFATTLYNAIYFAGLEDVYHKPHSIYFSRYPLGHEATLGWTLPDVIFRNDTDHPVTIETSYTGTSITVELVGSNGKRRVASSVSGTATTTSGGTVTVTRGVTYQDGSSTTRTWVHHYNPLPSSDGGDDEPPEPPSPPQIPL